MSIQPPLTPIRPKAAGAVGVKEAAEAAWAIAAIPPPEPVQPEPQPQPQSLASESSATSSQFAEESSAEQVGGAKTLQHPECKLDTDAAAMADDTIAAGAAAVPLPPSPTNAAAVAAADTAATPALASPVNTPFAAQPGTVPASAVAPTPSPSRVSRRRASLQAWPFYIVAAVEGSANASYAHFTPRRKTGARGALYSMPVDEELPDVADIDWWGAGSDTDDSQAPAASSPVDANRRPAESVAVSIDRDVTMSEAGAAAGPATPAPQPSPQSQLSAGPSSPPSALPSVDLVTSFGQDACFVISRPQLGCCVLGVADGVGGWSVFMRSDTSLHYSRSA